MAIATLWMIVSGLLGALSNFCMRKSMEGKGSAGAFFIFQLFFTFLVLTYLHPIQMESYSLNLYTLAMACTCGFTLALLKFIISYALKKGPAGLTFASVNCASVAPSLILVLLFSTLADFPYTVWNLLGSILVVIGLFWAISYQEQFLQKWTWLAFAITAFIMHTLFLFLTQLHMIVLEHGHWLDDFWRLGSAELRSEWFVPLIFASATLIHLLRYSIFERRVPIASEIVWGTCGGLLNGACSYFFMQATEVAIDSQRAFLFPIFSVTLIVTCNIWGQWQYKERINWRANVLCLLGVFTGTA